MDVRREEFNRLVEVLNERRVIINTLAQDIQDLQDEQKVQFRRIAQLQVQVDGLRKATGKPRGSD